MQVNICIPHLGLPGFHCDRTTTPDKNPTRLYSFVGNPMNVYSIPEGESVYSSTAILSSRFRTSLSSAHLKS